MLLPFIALDGMRGNGEKAYACTACGTLITHSDCAFQVSGKNRHVYVNPAGITCDFYTFHACPGAIALGEATAEHTWFPGYRWRMAFCGHCAQHLGWHYETISGSERPGSFWGILVERLADRKPAARDQGAPS
ncbi:MAG: hypothetical protein JW821_19575 [Deltaproteobacteria bacterium]|nr:hypothetical protein [Deltaproteobacteria bacterium]